MITPEIGRQVIHVDNVPVTVHVDNLTASSSGLSWEASATLVGKEPELLTGRLVVFPNGAKGFIARVATHVEPIEITEGPDWMIPARAPGMSTTTIYLWRAE